MDGACSTYKILVGKTEGKKPLGRPRCRWENIKMDLKTGCDGVAWIGMARDWVQCWAFVNTVMNFRVLDNIFKS
jgi:hypothetical protein